jgi:hypothetical protein
LKNLLKDKETYGTMEKHDVLNHIKEQIAELKGVSTRSSLDRENFKLASWPYLQAYEVGFLKALTQLEEIITIK